MRAAGRPQSAPGQRRSGTARSRARPVGRVALEGNATALVRAVPRCSPPGPAVAHAAVPGRSRLPSRHVLPGVGRRWPGVRAVPVADHEPGTYRPRAEVSSPRAAAADGCGELDKSVVLGHATIAVTVDTYTGRRPLDCTPAELITGRLLATGGRHSLADLPSARCLQIRLQVVSDEAVRQAWGTLKAPEPAGQGPSAVVGDTGIEPATSSV